MGVVGNEHAGIPTGGKTGTVTNTVIVTNHAKKMKHGAGAWMKHRFWVQPWWKDLGHCKCCDCGEGGFPLGGGEGIGGINGEVMPGSAHFCRYGKDCKPYSNTRLFFKTLTGHFVAWSEEDYERWVIFRAKRAIRKG